jgi:hypothetical protein
MKYLKTYNESLRDKMKPKSDKEILKDLGNLSPDEMLIKSTEHNFLKGVQKSLERGADVNCVNKYTNTPLLIACWKNYFDIIKFLLENGANVNCQNLHGETPLFMIIYRSDSFEEQFSSVELLLKYGADPYINLYDSEQNIFDYITNDKMKDFILDNYEKNKTSINEGKFIESNVNVDMSNPVDLLKEYPEFFYSDPTPKKLKEFTELLRPLRDKYSYRMLRPIKLYHGTSAELNIEKEGLLTTKQSTKKSMQSQTGFVYLSIFPDMAKTFGKMAYPKDDIVVYEVVVPAYYLLPDKDQLRNQRLFAGKTVNDTLADSALYGHGFRVKGNIPPYMIRKSKY